MTRAVVNTENRDYPDTYAGTGDNGSAVLGIEIINNSKTTVTPAGDGRNGYRIERTTGGGTYDAAASSKAGLTNNALLCIRFGSGDYAAGLSYDNPANNHGYTQLMGFLHSAGSLYIYSLGSQIGGSLGSPPAYGFVLYDDAANEVRLYTGPTDKIADAALIHTITPVDKPAMYFDSSLKTASADFEAYFTVS